MRQLCVLLVLAHATPAWAKTVNVPVGEGKSAKLTPQQVQFIRWWRVQTNKTVKPVTRSAALVPTKKLTITATKLNRPAVKTSTALIKPLMAITPAPTYRVPAAAGQAPVSSLSSLSSLRAVLIGYQPGTASGLKVLTSGQTQITTEPLRRQAATPGGLALTAMDRQLRCRPVPRAAKVARTGQLVIVPSRRTGAEPPPPDTLTKLRYQLELSQME